MAREARHRLLYAPLSKKPAVIGAHALLALDDDLLAARSPGQVDRPHSALAQEPLDGAPRQDRADQVSLDRDSQILEGELLHPRSLGGAPSIASERSPRRAQLLACRISTS